MKIPPIPAGIAVLTGAIDGALVSSDAQHAKGIPRLGPFSFLTVYRLLLFGSGAALTALTDWQPEVGTTLLVTGAYGVSASLGARAIKGKNSLTLQDAYVAPFGGYYDANGNWIPQAGSYLDEQEGIAYVDEQEGIGYVAGFGGHYDGNGNWIPEAGAGYVTADGRFIQGPPDPRDAPAFIARGLATPPESLRPY